MPHENNYKGFQDWKIKWNENAPPDAVNCLNIAEKPTGFDLLRKVWKTANRNKTEHGICADASYKLDKQPLHNCECEETYHTVKHIIHNCELTKYHGKISNMYTLPPSAIEWITNLLISL